MRRNNKRVGKKRSGIRYVSRFIGWLLLCVNVALAVAMVGCGYSWHVDPTLHPTISCCGLGFPILLAINVICLVFWLFVYKKYALLSLGAILICCHAAWCTCPLNFFRPAPPEGAIKMLSYNVMGFNWQQPHTADEPNPIIAYLQESDADIICLQEFSEGNRLPKKTIDDALKKYPYKSHVRMGRGWLKLACYSRYPILKVSEVAYESEANGSVAYELAIDGDTVVAINNHLESNKLTADDKALFEEMLVDHEANKVKENSKLLIRKLAQTVPTRAKQADAVAQLIDENRGRSVVVCGDFNTAPYSYAYRTIAAHLTDAFNESGFGPMISYHARGFFFRIDYILHSGDLKGYRCHIDHRVKTSDHYPIWCYLAKKTSK